MADYRLMSTRHKPDGSVEPPSAIVAISARDDAEAVRLARDVPPARFADDADFAWLVDRAGRVITSFEVALGRAA